MALNADWKTAPWRAFVAHVIGRFAAGETTEELSAALCGAEVEWMGVLAEVNLDEEFASGVAMTMDDPGLTINGVTVVANHLFLEVDPSSKPAWESIPRGTNVTFQGRIAGSSGPFPAVELSLADDVYLLTLSIESARPKSPMG